MLKYAFIINDTIEGLRMQKHRVNLGAGGFISYFEDGGAAVDLPTYDAESEEYTEDPYEEKGVGAFFSDHLFTGDSESDIDMSEGDMIDAIRRSGRANEDMSDTFYPEGPAFFEKLASDYNYPTEIMDDGTRAIDVKSGKTRFTRPRDDMPTPQELEDTRAHMLGTALTARNYGPETASKVGKIKETFFSNRLHQKMDLRNNAIGIDLFKKAGINATPAQITEAVDNRIFEQLNVILGRKPEEQEAPSKNPRWPKNFRSPADGPDLYFPRDSRGYFIPDNAY
jgi:hypothetical protein